MIKNIKIPFIKIMPIALAVSIILVIASVAFSIYKANNGGYNLGIDFAGGVELKVRIENDATINVSEMREIFSNFSENVNIQELEGDKNKNAFLLRFKGNNENSDDALTLLEGTYGDASVSLLGNTIISGVISGDNLKSALVLLLVAWIAITIYITIRFDIRFALPAIITLIHNVAIVFAIVLFLNKELTVLILSAFLTLIGYTINDVIVVFDRVRENLKADTIHSIEDIVNTSLNQTLGRTIMTSVTTLIAASSIMIWGGSILYNFAFTFFVGVIVGTYASNFISGKLLIMMYKINSKS